MESPQNAIWGPPLWMILHSSAERYGQTNFNQKHEQHVWFHLIRSLRYSLPCPLCKRHFNEYYETHPKPLYTRENLRKWLYELHSHVNQQHNKLDAFTLEQIPEVYGEPFHFTKESRIVLQHMGYAVRIGWINREDVIRTAKLFEQLKIMYDFF